MNPIFSAAAAASIINLRNNPNYYSQITPRSDATQFKRLMAHILGNAVIGAVAFSFVPVIGPIAGIFIGAACGIFTGMIHNSCSKPKEDQPIYYVNVDRVVDTESCQTSNKLRTQANTAKQQHSEFNDNSTLFHARNRHKLNNIKAEEALGTKVKPSNYPTKKIY